MSFKLFSNALTGKAAVAVVTDSAVQTTNVIANSDFGRWTHIVKIEPDLSDLLERKEKLFLYNQNRRDAAIGRLGEKGFVADETFGPGSLGTWSHIAAVGSLLFFYNQMTGAGAVAATEPQHPKIVEVKDPPFELSIPPHLVPGKVIPANQAPQPSTSEYFVTVSTYAPGSLGNWSHIAASGSYLLFYNQGDGSGRISELKQEPLTSVKELALGAKVSLRSIKDLGKGSIGHWTDVVGAKPYLLFYNEGSGAGQVAEVSDTGLNVVSKLAKGSLGRWTHVTVGVELIKTTKNHLGLGFVEANGASILFYDAGSRAGALGQLSDDSFKKVKTFGPGEFGRWTSISNTTVTADPLAQYTLTRSPSGLRITSLGGDYTDIDISSEKLTPEQQKEILNTLDRELWDFLGENWEEIKKGNIKAADIGGVTFGIVGALIADVFVPGLGQTILGEILKKGSVQHGRFYGAAVDTLIDQIKHIDQVNLAHIVGTLGTIHIIALYLPWMPITGTDGWSLTVEIGKKLGETTEDAINTIGGIVGDVTGSVIKVAEDAYEVARGIWDSIF